MANIFDEIMSIKEPPVNVYWKGYNDGINAAAEIAKKYDNEIDRLNKKIEYLFELL